MTLSQHDDFLYSRSAKLLKLFLIIFVLIQPFFDCYFFYTEELSAVIGFTIPPLISVFWAFMMLFLYFVSDLKGRLRRKSCMIFIVYLAVCAVYFVIHHLTNLDFISVDATDYDYSIVQEAYYICRLLIPFIVLLLTYELSVSKDEFYRCIEIVAAIVSVTIVVSNIFCFSLSSYTNEPISCNIFTWFNGLGNRHDAKELTSKGFFCYANQTSALMMFLFPVLLYRLFSKWSGWRALLVVSQILAMLMIGTQAATYGVLLELVVFLAVVIFCGIMLKKINKPTMKSLARPLALLLALIIAVGVTLPYTPVVGKALATAKLHKDREHAEERLKLPSDDEFYHLSFDDRVKFMNEVFLDYSLQWSFCKEAYPLDDDPDFWYEMIGLPLEQRFDFRFVETEIMKTVIGRNDDITDVFFGISNTRQVNICKVEHDYQAQYYSLGAVGVVVFMAPYVIFSLWYSLRALYRKNRKDIFENLSLAMAMDVLLGVGYVTGNCLDVLFTTVIMGLFLGRMLLNVRESEGCQGNE